MSEWPARLDGDLWRCGRLEDARYACEGIVARTTVLPSGQRVTAYRHGYKWVAAEQPPTGSGLPWYLPLKKRRRTRKPRRDSPDKLPRRDALAPFMPTRTRCPKCRTIAIVPAKA